MSAEDTKKFPPLIRSMSAGDTKKFPPLIEDDEHVPKSVSAEDTPFAFDFPPLIPHSVEIDILSRGKKI